jgi:outer membrane immunogenic protein
VVGIEADWSWTGLKLKAIVPVVGPGGSTGVSSNAFGEIDVKDIVTVRGRIGYAATPSWLLYGTGGWAIAHLDYSGGWTCTFPDCGTTDVASLTSFSRNPSGWVAGAGTEYRWPGTGFVLGVAYFHYRLDAAATGSAIISRAESLCAAARLANAYRSPTLASMRSGRV